MSKKNLCVNNNYIELVFATLEDKRLIYELLVHKDIVNSMFNESYRAPTWEEFNENEQERYFTGKSDVGGSYLLIYLNDNIVGSISYSINNSKVLHAEIDIWLKSKFTGKGIGTNAIELLLNYIVKIHNIKTFIIRPWNKNINAIKAYKKVGFTEIIDFNPRDYYTNDEIDHYGDGDYGVEETINLIKIIE